MLPDPYRLRHRRDFALATRRGRRAGAGTLVIHLARPAAPDPPGRTETPPVRIGVVVSHACGPAVVRNRIRRRLRHRLRGRLSQLPEGAIVVVRALPAAAEATSLRLDADLEFCLDRLVPVGDSGAGS